MINSDERNQEEKQKTSQGKTERNRNLATLGKQLERSWLACAAGTDPNKDK